MLPARDVAGAGRQTGPRGTTPHRFTQHSFAATGGTSCSDPPKSSPRIKGSMHPRFEEILTPEALAFVAKLDGAHSGRRAELLAARRERGKRISAGEPVDFLTSTAEIRSRRRLAGRPAGAGPGGPARGDHRPADPQDEHQRAELRREGVDGRLRGRHLAELDQRHRRPDQPARRDPRRTWSSPPRTARNTRSARSPRRSWSGPAAGGSARSTSASTGARCRPRWSTSGCSSSTTRSS